MFIKSPKKESLLPVDEDEDELSPDRMSPSPARKALFNELHGHMPATAPTHFLSSPKAQSDVVSDMSSDHASLLSDSLDEKFKSMEQALEEKLRQNFAVDRKALKNSANKDLKDVRQSLCDQIEKQHTSEKKIAALEKSCMELHRKNRKHQAAFLDLRGISMVLKETLSGILHLVEALGVATEPVLGESCKAVNSLSRLEKCLLKSGVLSEADGREIKAGSTIHDFEMATTILPGRDFQGACIELAEQVHKMSRDFLWLDTRDGYDESKKVVIALQRGDDVGTLGNPGNLGTNAICTNEQQMLLSASTLSSSTTMQPTSSEYSSICHAATTTTPTSSAQSSTRHATMPTPNGTGTQVAQVVRDVSGTQVAHVVRDVSQVSQVSRDSVTFSASEAQPLHAVAYSASETQAPGDATPRLVGTTYSSLRKDSASNRSMPHLDGIASASPRKGVGPSHSPPRTLSAQVARDMAALNTPGSSTITRLQEEDLVLRSSSPGSSIAASSIAARVHEDELVFKSPSQGSSIRSGHMPVAPVPNWARTDIETQLLPLEMELSMSGSLSTIAGVTIVRPGSPIHSAAGSIRAYPRGGSPSMSRSGSPGTSIRTQSANVIRIQSPSPRACPSPIEPRSRSTSPTDLRFQQPMRLVSSMSPSHSHVALPMSPSHSPVPPSPSLSYTRAASASKAGSPKPPASNKSPTAIRVSAAHRSPSPAKIIP